MKEIHPPRGLVKDRMGEIIVANQPMYNLLVTAINVKTFDTLKFCGLIGISKEVCSKKPKTAYICYDSVTGIKKFAMVKEIAHLNRNIKNQYKLMIINVNIM
jgi:cell division protein FtsI/penicillin-binding protein 2